MLRETQGTIYADTPPPRVFFQILIDYTSEHVGLDGVIPEDDRFLESDLLPNFKEAYSMAEAISEDIKKKFDSCHVEMLTPDDADDEYMFYIIDPDDDEIARIGIRVCDFRGISVH